MLEPGQEAPDFTLPRDGGGTLTLSALRGRKVVLYFYPRDDTPGCTAQALGFSAQRDAFEAAGALVVGVSRDDPASHARFREKHALELILVSDTDGAVCEAYGAWGEKRMYGRVSQGILRSSFLIGEDGAIREVWRNVRVPGHIEAVLEAAAA